MFFPRLFSACLAFMLTIGASGAGISQIRQSAVLNLTDGAAGVEAVDIDEIDGESVNIEIAADGSFDEPRNIEADISVDEPRKVVSPILDDEIHSKTKSETEIFVQPSGAILQETTKPTKHRA